MKVKISYLRPGDRHWSDSHFDGARIVKVRHEVSGVLLTVIERPDGTFDLLERKTDPQELEIDLIA